MCQEHRVQIGFAYGRCALVYLLHDAPWGGGGYQDRQDEDLSCEHAGHGDIATGSSKVAWSFGGPSSGAPRSWTILRRDTSCYGLWQPRSVRR